MNHNLNISKITVGETLKSEKTRVDLENGSCFTKILYKACDNRQHFAYSGTFIEKAASWILKWDPRSIETYCNLPKVCNLVSMAIASASDKGGKP